MKHLLALLITLLFAVTARAETPATCSGTDLVAKLKDDDPAAYAAVMKEAAETPNGQAVFWKIERDGVAPSWLLGTAHVTDPRVTALPPGAGDALSKASAVVLELAELKSSQDMALATLKYASLMVLPPGKTLWDLIPDDQEAKIRDNPNLPMGGATAIYGYQPWVVAAMLSIPLCESQRKLAGILTLDEMIAGRASLNHTQILGLETVKEQLSVFADMPLDLQTKYLLAVADVGPRMNDYFETLNSLYQQRKVTAYMPFARRDPSSKLEGADAMMAFVEEDLVRKRNHRMASRAAEILKGGNAFIAVGALHLPGKEGLVELLRAAGYKVTPVN